MPGPREEYFERIDAISSSLYYLYGYTLAQEPLHGGGGVYDLNILVYSSLIIITIFSDCLKFAQEKKRISLKKIHFLPQNYLPLGGAMSFTIFVSLT